MTVQKKRIIIIFVSIIVVVCLPLIAMQFTDKVQWSLFDFIIATILLLSAGLSVHFIFQKVKKMKYRITLLFLLLVLFLVTWIEIAVGLFGTEISGS